jgi:hypothetical protein
MDPTHVATAIVASPAWDLVVATSVVAVEVSAVVAFAAAASVVAAEAFEVEASGVVVDAPEVAAVVAGKRCES